MLFSLLSMRGLCTRSPIPRTQRRKSRIIESRRECDQFAGQHLRECKVAWLQNEHVTSRESPENYRFSDVGFALSSARSRCEVNSPGDFHLSDWAD